jgi:hypothetical protein
VRGALALLLGLAALAAGCGGEDDEPEANPGLPAPDHAKEVARNPYALTCADIRRQPKTSTASRLVIDAEFALAEVPELRQVVKKETRNRTGRSVYYALTEICRGRPPEFEPARLAVEAVREGRYRAARNRPG